jgi:nucleoside-diphosphate-sugar epimerase
VSTLVTGHRGFIGRRLFNSFTGLTWGYDLKEVARVDTTVIGSQPTTVFHLGSRVGAGESHTQLAGFVQDNVLGTAELLEALEREGTVEHMVLASSCVAMYGGTPYAVTKAAQEDLCEVWCARNNVTLSVLRLHAVYGPGQGENGTYEGVVAKFAHALARGDAPVVDDDGLQLRDFVHVDDVVRAMRLAAEHRFHGTTEIGTGHATHLIDMVSRLREYIGGPLPIITGERRLGDVKEMRADLRGTERFFWSPQITFEKGIAEYAEALGRVAA